MLEMRGFTLSPRRFFLLSFGERVATASYDMFNSRTELFPNFNEPWLSTAIFGNIVKQRPDGLVFISAGFDYKRSHSERVTDVRDIG